MFVYICCSGGATSSMLCQRVAKASGKKTVIGYILELLGDIDRHLAENELVLAYGPADYIKETNLKDTGLDKKISCIYIAPQVRFLAPAAKKYLDTIHIPIQPIEMKTFGTMDGEKAWQEIQAMLG